MNEHIAAEVFRAIKELFDIDFPVQATQPEPQFGDAATNVAMQLTKQLSRPPREIAEAIAEKLREHPYVTEVSIAGPGFINIWVADSFLASTIDEQTTTDKHRQQTVVIETNNPNPFKDLHIGHAYNSIVADTIANLVETGGAKTHRVSYHGDIGLHVGKSMWAILRFIDGDVTKLETVELSDRPAFMSRMYVEGAAAYKDDEKARAEIEALTKQSFVLDDALFKEVYETCKAWSFDYIDDTMKRLGSQPVERRFVESEADAVGVATVNEHIGDVFAESDGAVIFPGESHGLHTRVFVSSRGTGLYEARDLGLMQLKQREFHPDKSIIVTGEEQRDYFNVVIKAAELCTPELNGVTQNIPTGMVKLSTGKMSSRTGKVLNIEWLFEQLAHAVGERGEQTESGNVIIGALRYALLKVRVGSDVVFDINESVSIEGNSGPYLQYAHARARSILSQREVQQVALGDAEFDDYERLLVLKLAEYPEVLKRAVGELLPHHICTYLYELAQTFNRFYEHSRVLDDPREALRLQLTLRYADRLRDGLHLLGIPAPDRL